MRGWRAVPDTLPQCAAGADRAGTCHPGRRACQQKREKGGPRAVYTWRCPNRSPSRRSPRIFRSILLYEDDDLLVVNKPKGMVVHPAPATRTALSSMHCFTTVPGSCPASAARSAPASYTASIAMDQRSAGGGQKTMPHQALSAQMSVHSIHRVYHAVVYGNLRGGRRLCGAVDRS